MSKDLLLVELYAGLASLSLWFFGGRPPLGRRGSKTAYAERIARALLGDRRPTRLLLNDADAGVANVLRCLCDPRIRIDVAGRIEDVSRIQQRAYVLWREIAQMSHPNDPSREASRWLMVSAGSAKRDASAGSGINIDRVPRSGDGYHYGFSPTLESLAERVRAWPLDASFCDVRHGPAETLDPIKGARVYLDPPYVGTNGYASISLLPVRSVAERWSRAGCRVGLSETLASQAPVGWPCVDLSTGAGSSRQMIRSGRRELLFLSP